MIQTQFVVRFLPLLASFTTKILLRSKTSLADCPSGLTFVCCCKSVERDCQVWCRRNESKGNRCTNGAASRHAAHAAFSRSLTDAHASTHFSHTLPLSNYSPRFAPAPFSILFHSCTQSCVHSCNNRCNSSLLHVQCSFLSPSLSRVLYFHYVYVHRSLPTPRFSIPFFSFSSPSFSSLARASFPRQQQTIARSFE